MSEIIMTVAKAVCIVLIVGAVSFLIGCFGLAMYKYIIGDVDK